MAVMTNTSLESGSHNTDNYMKIFVSVYTHMHTKASMGMGEKILGGKKPNPNQKTKTNNDNPPKETNNKKKTNKTENQPQNPQMY